MASDRVSSDKTCMSVSFSATILTFELETKDLPVLQIRRGNRDNIGINHISA